MDLLAISARLALDKSEYDKAMDDASKSAQEFSSDFDDVASDVSGSAESIESSYEDLSDAMAGTADDAGELTDAFAEMDNALYDDFDHVDELNDALDEMADSMVDTGDDADGLSKSLGDVGDEAGNTSGSFEGMEGSAFALTDILTGGLASGLTVVIEKAKELAAAVWDGVKDLAEYGDNIDKMSQKMGISAEAYQEWDAVMQHSGTSIDSMRRGMMSISGAMDEVRNSANKTIDTREIEKTRLAFESAKLSVTEAKQAYSKAVKEHGQNSLEARKAAQRVAEAESNSTDAYLAYQAAVKGTSPELGKAALAIQKLRVQITDTNGNLRSQEDVFKDTIFALQNITDETERTTIAQDIFGRSAMELGPLLNTSAEDTQAMIDRVHELGGVLSDDTVKASAGFQDAMQDFNTAISGLKNSVLAQILPPATKVISALTDLLVSLRGFAEGIGKIVGSVTGFFADIIAGITTTVANFIPNAVRWGQDLIQNFTNGILSFISKPIEAIKGLASRIWSFLHFSEPEAGPLADFHTYAPDMMKLFAEGITGNANLVTDAINDAFDLQPSMAMSGPSGVGQEYTVPQAGSAPSIQEATIEIDRSVFARVIFKLYNEEARRVGATLAGVNI